MERHLFFSFCWFFFCFGPSYVAVFAATFVASWGGAFLYHIFTFLQKLPKFCHSHLNWERLWLEKKLQYLVTRNMTNIFLWIINGLLMVKWVALFFVSFYWLWRMLILFSKVMIFVFWNNLPVCFMFIATFFALVFRTYLCCVVKFFQNLSEEHLKNGHYRLGGDKNQNLTVTNPTRYDAATYTCVAATELDSIEQSKKIEIDGLFSLIIAERIFLCCWSEGFFLWSNWFEA